MTSRFSAPGALCLLGVSIVFIASECTAGILLAQDHPPLLLDLSQLNLKVTSSEVVESVCEPSGRCVQAKDTEHKLVVVTMSGFLKKPSMVSLLANDFSATPVDASFWRTTDRSVGIYMNGFWTLDKGSNQEMGIVAVPFSAAGPITLRVAFPIRQNTGEFYVGYPAFAAGRASAAAAARHGKP